MKVKELIEKLKNLNQDEHEICVFHFGMVTNVDPADENDNTVCIRTDSEDNE